jgi:hypothetical protein
VRRPSAALNGAKSARGLAHSKTLARKVQVDEFAPAERTFMDSKYGCTRMEEDRTRITWNVTSSANDRESN